MVSSAAMMNSENTVCRNPPGTKAADFYKWPAQKLDEMDSTLAVQQYIQQTIRQDFTDVEKILSAPLGQDEGVWKYEHLRQFCLELNSLAVRLQAECTPETCTQMTATEQWIFLCAAHKTPKECPAIDYTRHTLDGAACLLNSNKYFPSRVSIKDSSVAKLGSVCRRVYRIFSHAYYHHRQVFDEAENETFLCRRFTSFVIKYNLMSRDNLIVPILSDSSSDGNSSNNNSVKAALTASYSIAKKPPNASSGITSFLNLPEGVVPDGDDVEIDEQFGDVLDDVDDSGALVDDDFSYSGDAQYATLKPMKEDPESVPQKETTEEEPSDGESTNVEEEATLDSTVIDAAVEENDSTESATQDSSLTAESPVEDED